MPSATAITTLNAVSDPATGTVANFAAARSQVTAVVVPSGTITGGSVAFEASQDNTNWVTIWLFTPRDRNEFYSTQSFGAAFRYWRCSVVSKIAGGTVKATLMYSDHEGGLL